MLPTAPASQLRSHVAPSKVLSQKRGSPPQSQQASVPGKRCSYAPPHMDQKRSVGSSHHRSLATAGSEVVGRRLEVGGWRLEVGGWRSEVGGRRPEARRQRSEVRGQRPEARDVACVCGYCPCIGREGPRASMMSTCKAFQVMHMGHVHVPIYQDRVTSHHAHCRVKAAPKLRVQGQGQGQV